jgi:ATPase subunit of ABC transporter with duplicated ATPase domains
MSLILQLTIDEKKMGNKLLLHDASLLMEEGEKIALIGRNGTGKSTLFGLIDGSDDNFHGRIQLRKGATLISTRQEHADLEEMSVIDYILSELPRHAELHHILETYPDTMGDSMKLIEEYSAALEEFAELGYYDVEDRVIQDLAAYQLDETKARDHLSKLSGGQKRFVELVKVTQSKADLVLLDEPTNHMDAVGKAAFVKWLASTPLSVIVISHDRDVLHVVDRIVELKEKGLQSFKGNYDAYLKQNTTSTTSDVMQYEVAQRTIENLEKQLIAVRAKKAGSSKNPNPFIPMERRLMKQLKDLQANNKKPAFWIDQESVAQLKPEMQKNYDKYKARGLRMRPGGGDSTNTVLVDITELQLGYGSDKATTSPLFTPVNLRLRSGERAQLEGRNGAGKTTFIRALMNQARGGEEGGGMPLKLHGTMTLDRKLIVGMYDQEIEAQYLHMPLGEAIMDAYHAVDKPINDQKVRQLLGDYMFDPSGDYDRSIANMSGGQKARFQIIMMLAADPNLLILDEPTNHLDLPSIEELEAALLAYRGAILYVSHDSYFSRNLEGEVITIAASAN